MMHCAMWHIIIYIAVLDSVSHLVEQYKYGVKTGNICQKVFQIVLVLKPELLNHIIHGDNKNSVDKIEHIPPNYPKSGQFQKKV